MLGKQLEALDPIRMRTECFITWSGDISAFKIMGEIIGVQKALKQLRYTCFQIASRNIAPNRRYISHWRTEGPGAYVHLDEEYIIPQIIESADEPSLMLEASKTPRVECKVTDKSDIETIMLLQTCSIQAMQVTLADALQKIHYLRGHIRFRIRLGTFVLASHKRLEEGSSWDLSEYEEMTLLPQFRGRVTEEYVNTPLFVVLR